MGYKVTLDPSRIPTRKLWHDAPASLGRGLRYRPDILAERDEKSVIVEVKTHPVPLGGVMQSRQYADYFGQTVILCITDEVFPEVPNSVWEFADEQRVRLCPLSEIGSTLTDLSY